MDEWHLICMFHFDFQRNNITSKLDGALKIKQEANRTQFSIRHDFHYD